VKQFQRRAVALMIYGLLGLYFAWFLSPILLGVFASFRETATELTKIEEPTGFGVFTLRHYSQFFQDPNLPNYLKNSFLLAGLTSLCTTILVSLGGYSLSRLHLPGRDGILTLVFSSRMFPFMLILLPVFTIFLNLGLVKTLLGFVLAHIALAVPFTLWIAKVCFDQIPRELEEAALLDGCNRFAVLHKITLPLAAPGIVVVAFYAFTISWGDYMIVSLLLQSQNLATLPVSLAAIINSGQASWGMILAVTTVSMIPPMFFFAFVQRWFNTSISIQVMK
jgi:ABC-type glycerol-3-phosphate transport system permease component